MSNKIWASSPSVNAAFSFPKQYNSSHLFPWTRTQVWMLESFFLILYVQPSQWKLWSRGIKLGLQDSASCLQKTKRLVSISGASNVNRVLSKESKANPCCALVKENCRLSSFCHETQLLELSAVHLIPSFSEAIEKTSHDWKSEVGNEVWAHVLFSY